MVHIVGFGKHRLHAQANNCRMFGLLILTFETKEDVKRIINVNFITLLHLYVKYIYNKGNKKSANCKDINDYVCLL